MGGVLDVECVKCGSKSQIREEDMREGFDVGCKVCGRIDRLTADTARELLKSLAILMKHR